MTRGWSLPESVRPRTSKVVLASIPTRWNHLEERRVPGPPTERALDPRFDLLRHADPCARHTHCTVVASVSMELSSARRSQSFSCRIGLHQHACVVSNLHAVFECFRLESGSASSRLNSCNPTSSAGSSDNNSCGTYGNRPMTSKYGVNPPRFPRRFFSDTFCHEVLQIVRRENDRVPSPEGPQRVPVVFHTSKSGGAHQRRRLPAGCQHIPRIVQSLRGAPEHRP